MNVANLPVEQAEMSPEFFSGDTELNDLARQANAAHKACEQATRSALVHARDCGGVLLDAKRMVGHGAWTMWVSKNCTFSERQARRYMLVARRWFELLGRVDDQVDRWDSPKRTRVSDLGIESMSVREAIAMLTGQDEKPVTAAHKSVSIFEGGRCPSCGSQMVRTSAIYHTCPECQNCKLHRNNESFLDGCSPARSAYQLCLPSVDLGNQLRPTAGADPLAIKLFELWKKLGTLDRAWVLAQIRSPISASGGNA